MKCNRKDCFAYNEKENNNCGALKEVYKDDSKCVFFKKQDKVDFTTKQLIQERNE